MDLDRLYRIAKSVMDCERVCGAIKHVRARLIGKGHVPLLVLVHDRSVHQEPEHLCAMDGNGLVDIVRDEAMVPDEVEIVVIDLDEDSEKWASGDFREKRAPAGPNGKTYSLPRKKN